MSLLIFQPCLPLANSKDTVFSLGITSLSDQISHKRNKALAQGHMASLVSGVIEGMALLLGWAGALSVWNWVQLVWANTSSSCSQHHRHHASAYWQYAWPPSQPFPTSSHRQNPLPTGGFRNALLLTSQNPSDRQLLYASIGFPKLSDLCLVGLQPFGQLLFLLSPWCSLSPTSFLLHKWILQFQH